MTGASKGARSRLQQPRPPRPRLEPRRAPRHPAQGQRSARRVAAADLCQPQPRRAPLGKAEGVACRRHTLREDRRVLPRRPLPRRHRRLAQALTGPSEIGQRHTAHAARIALEDARQGGPRMGSRSSKQRTLHMSGYIQGSTSCEPKQSIELEGGRQLIICEASKGN